MLTAAQNGVIEVSASRYGGFEQVGSLPQSFSRNDVQTTTQPGDIVLYSGNQLVIFFGSNSWRYTRRGHIEGLFTDELTALLDKDVTVIEIKTTKGVFFETYHFITGACGLTGRSGKFIHTPFLPKNRPHIFRRTSNEPRKQTQNL